MIFITYGAMIDRLRRQLIRSVDSPHVRNRLRNSFINCNMYSSLSVCLCEQKYVKMSDTHICDRIRTISLFRIESVRASADCAKRTLRRKTRSGRIQPTRIFGRRVFSACDFGDFVVFVASEPSAHGIASRFVRARILFPHHDRINRLKRSELCFNSIAIAEHNHSYISSPLIPFLVLELRLE